MIIVLMAHSSYLGGKGNFNKHGLYRESMSRGYHVTQSINNIDYLWML